MNYSVSIVVISHNTSDWIEDCLNSVFSQNLQNVQTIIIDSGSTDDTCKKIKHLIKDKKDVKFIRQSKNIGGANAGNIGIKKAKGKYVFLMDSDDILPPDSLEKLYTAAKTNKSDIVIGRAKSIINDEIKNFKFKFYSIPGCKPGNFKEIKKNHLISPFYWGKLYKRDMLSKNNVFMPKNKLYADMHFYYKALLSAKKITVTDNLCYLWRRFTDDNIHVAITSESSQKSNFIERLESYNQVKALFSAPDKSELLETVKLYNLVRLLVVSKFAKGDKDFAEVYFSNMQEYLKDIPLEKIAASPYIGAKRKLICFAIKNNLRELFEYYCDPDLQIPRRRRGKYTVFEPERLPENTPPEFLRQVVSKFSACECEEVFFNYSYRQYEFRVNATLSDKCNLDMVRSVLTDEKGNEIYVGKIKDITREDKNVSFWLSIPDNFLNSIEESNECKLSIESLINKNFSESFLSKEKEPLVFTSSNGVFLINGSPVSDFNLE